MVIQFRVEKCSLTGNYVANFSLYLILRSLGDGKCSSSKAWNYYHSYFIYWDSSSFCHMNCVQYPWNCHLFTSLCYSTCKSLHTIQVDLKLKLSSYTWITFGWERNLVGLLWMVAYAYTFARAYRDYGSSLPPVPLYLSPYLVPMLIHETINLCLLFSLSKISAVRFRCYEIATLKDTFPGDRCITNCCQRNFEIIHWRAKTI